MILPYNTHSQQMLHRYLNRYVLGNIEAYANWPYSHHIFHSILFFLNTIDDFSFRFKINLKFLPWTRRRLTNIGKNRRLLQIIVGDFRRQFQYEISSKQRKWLYQTERQQQLFWRKKRRKKKKKKKETAFV